MIFLAEWSFRNENNIRIVNNLYLVNKHRTRFHHLGAKYIATRINERIASMIYLRDKLAELRLELFALISQKWTAIKQGLDTDLVFVQDNINFYRNEIMKTQSKMKGGK